MAVCVMLRQRRIAILLSSLKRDTSYKCPTRTSRVSSGPHAHCSKRLYIVHIDIMKDFVVSCHEADHVCSIPLSGLCHIVVDVNGELRSSDWLRNYGKETPGAIARAQIYVRRRYCGFLDN